MMTTSTVPTLARAAVRVGGTCVIVDRVSTNEYARPEAPVHWVVEGMPRIEVANQFLAQLDHAGGTPDQVVLTIGQTIDAGTPPTVLSALAMGRYGMTPARLDELIMALLNARQELLGLTEEVGPDAPAADAEAPPPYPVRPGVAELRRPH
jgi:hypothetical protein